MLVRIRRLYKLRFIPMIQILLLHSMFQVGLSLEEKRVAHLRVPRGTPVRIGDQCEMDQECPKGAICLKGGETPSTGYSPHKYCDCRSGRPRHSGNVQYCPEVSGRFTTAGSRTTATINNTVTPLRDKLLREAMHPRWLFPETFAREDSAEEDEEDSSSKEALMKPMRSPPWFRAASAAAVDKSYVTPENGDIKDTPPSLLAGQRGEKRTMKELLQTFIDILKARQSQTAGTTRK